MTYKVYIQGSFSPALVSTDSEQVIAFLDENNLYMADSGCAKNGENVIYIDCERRR